jgi:glycosyltransferase involved in cell wall biosynthesis
MPDALTATMRILVVTPFMWSGAGSVIVRLACALQSLGHDLCVVSSGESKGFTDWPNYVEQLQASQIAYNKIDFFDRSPDVFWASVEKLRNLVETFEPDVIHAHSGVSAFGAITSAKVPTLATLHSWNPSRPAWMNTMDVWALNRCDRVACVSSSYREHLLKHGLSADSSFVIPLGIEHDKILNLANEAEHNPLAEQKYFCYLGRLESRKRQELLVDALRYLPEDWFLMLIGGEGEPGYAQRILDRAREAGVSDRLICTGQVVNPHPFVKGARCFVSASADEGLGLSTLEAMALRVPVVSTAACGINDFIEHGRTGLVADPEPASLAERILYLDTQPKTADKLKSRAAAIVRETYSWPATVEKYSLTFQQLHP